ncbi:hypothetical protein Q31b_21790 [Novipirellula aureliae]|uniref:Uncharacterized protein n=1 Tax=Novipirellula aureliae TaxID=2527966 RepID=A0A5C6E682_9BACT|nr:hypothetical protein [Novipirellula aureliae]TWU43141.1 hypothetical protein Q31b_21790 [Novipirellula aureliae]
MISKQLTIPPSLKAQLLRFRGRVWSLKLIEAFAIAACAITTAFLAVYLVDRWGGMPGGLRFASLLATIAVMAIVPWTLYRWVWKNRTLEPLAKLLGKKMPAVGDQLLGVIELSNSESEQARSPALCQAAMQQVAADAEKRNLCAAVPTTHHRLWGGIASILVAVCVAVASFYPAASANAGARLLMPWRDVPRYTFTRIDDLPSNVVVAHGEAAPLAVRLTSSTVWHPERAKLQIGNQPPITADLLDREYRFVVPPQIVDAPMTLMVGDVTETMTLKPTLRPELTSVLAEISLPQYLGHEEIERMDSRSGNVSIVRGSEATFTAIANRPLASGTVNQTPSVPRGAELASDPVNVDMTPQLEFSWKDEQGLDGREPFTLSINAIDDESPTLICDGLERMAVILDSETVTFTVRASDDFGVRRVGMMWRGLPMGVVAEPAQGERPLIAGDHHAGSIDAIGTFSAKSLGVEPQPIELFAWAEDYKPGRERVYSPPHILYVLTPDQHAIWMTEQLSKWHRQALEVRDRERQLFEKNKELRSLSSDELSTSDRRREVQRQSAAENANGRRLERLGVAGADLLRTASKNPEIGVGHLERWAEMLGILDDLANHRMPSVADLLSESAKSIAGQMRDAKPGSPSPAADGKPPKLRSAPSLADRESSMNSPDEEIAGAGSPKKPSSPALRLPVTTVMGKGQKPDDDSPPANQQESLDQAVVEQEDLLAEFDKIADELNSVLANLEGSTLVKRLKAASREQNQMAGKLTTQLQSAFGQSKAKVEKPTREVLGQLSETQEAGVLNISYIMDDLAAYFERRRFAQFKLVLDEMKEADVLGSLRELAGEIPVQQGVSIAQTEYWADTMDRWAETLVDPACSGQCPGGKSPESLPPSIVLEVLQILEGEVSLRDETRVAEQSKPAIEPQEHRETAEMLSDNQTVLNERVVKVIERIGELEDAEKHFAKELGLLAQVDQVMGETTGILRSPDTGANAIAAETEVIELLLRSKRINPKGGGGGGSSPGGGGFGTTSDSALALIGQGRNAKEVREDKGVSQTTGETGSALPEEFRHGLDQYFNRLGGS